MATNKSGGAGRGRSSTRSASGGRSSSFISAVRERPLAAAGIAAGAAGAGAFLWAKRAQLTEQVHALSDALAERWMPSGSEAEALHPEGHLHVEPMTGAGTSSAIATSGRGRKLNPTGHMPTRTDPTAY